MKAKYKMNNGRGTLKCENCGTMIKQGHQITPEEWKLIRSGEQVEIECNCTKEQPK